MPISSGLLVQADEGVSLPVVDLIRLNLPPPTEKRQSPCDSGWSQAPVASKAPGSDYFSNGNSTSLVAPNQVHDQFSSGGHEIGTNHLESHQKLEKSILRGGRR
ncbi:hypothetical protein F511_39705 [Dorcoceras hygrometricum]|uniref:Uncharacterized protein n=1 Tax=Dorcoceras hygrometricum TaxID=472368 RepID=A0A2Z7DAM4_9LAMI|nr:hypothetical protein F511_39705 [Dorcoceras hygrometricum]